MPKEYVTAKMIVNRNGEDIEIGIEGMVHYDVDTNYGADADGNRGSMMTFVEEVTDVNGYDIGADANIPLSDWEVVEATGMIANKFMEG